MDDNIHFTFDDVLSQLNEYIFELETEQAFDCFECINLEDIMEVCDLDVHQIEILREKIDKIMKLQFKYWTNVKK